MNRRERRHQPHDRSIRIGGDNLATGARPQIPHHLHVGAVLEKAHRTIGERHVGAAWVITRKAVDPWRVTNRPGVIGRSAIGVFRVRRQQGVSQGIAGLTVVPVVAQVALVQRAVAQGSPSGPRTLENPLLERHASPRASESEGPTRY